MVSGAVKNANHYLLFNLRVQFQQKANALTSPQTIAQYLDLCSEA